MNITDDIGSPGGRLRMARESRSLNQTELAKLANLEPSTIGHFEKNRRKPSFANLCLLAESLYVSSDYLLGLTYDMNGSNTKFKGEEKLSSDQRSFVQLIINTLNNPEWGAP